MSEVVEVPNAPERVGLEKFGETVVGMIVTVLESGGGVAYQIADVAIGEQREKLAVIVLSGAPAEKVAVELAQRLAQEPKPDLKDLLANFNPTGPVQ
jgi:hypothetical protein